MSKGRKKKKKDELADIPWKGLCAGWDANGKCFIQFVGADDFYYSYSMTPKIAEKLSKCLTKVAKKARKEKK